VPLGRAGHPAGWHEGGRTFTTSGAPAVCALVMPLLGSSSGLTYGSITDFGRRDGDGHRHDRERRNPDMSVIRIAEACGPGLRGSQGQPIALRKQTDGRFDL
jgi:hypothetical protein